MKQDDQHLASTLPTLTRLFFPRGVSQHLRACFFAASRSKLTGETLKDKREK